MPTVYPYIGGTPSKAKFDNNSGEALSGGKVYFYVAGTSTPKDTYSDSAGTVLNANPVILDSRGEANIFFLGDEAYKVIVKDSADVTIYTVDNVSAMVDIYSLSRTDNTTFGDALVGGKLTSSGSVAFTLNALNEKRPVYATLDFGVVADGVTNDTTALANFFNAAIANPGQQFILPVGTMLTTAALPTINAKGVWIEGAGNQTPHDVGSETVLSTIKYTGTAGATVLTVAPSTGASAQRLEGVKLRGLGIDGNSLAAKGVLIQSVQNSEIRIYARECTTSSIEIGVVGTLGEATDTQFNDFHITTENLLTTGAGLRLTGDATGNVSLNVFQNVNVQHLNGTGVVEENADNNIWLNTRTFRGGSGTGNGIIWQGGAASGTRARAETFLKLSCNSDLIVKGTGAYAVAAENIRIYELDFENNPTVAPTIEAGATCYWRDNRHTFIGFAADDASGTSYGVGPTDIGFANEDYDPLSKFVTPTFTAPMPGKYQFSLKLTHTAGVTVGDRWVFKIVTSNRTYSFQYLVHTADVNTVQFSVVANMDASDTAKCTIERGGGTGNFPLVNDVAYNAFSGYMAEGV